MNELGTIELNHTAKRLEAQQLYQREYQKEYYKDHVRTDTRKKIKFTINPRWKRCFSGW